MDAAMEKVLARLQTAVWLFNPVRQQVVFANSAAARLVLRAAATPAPAAPTPTAAASDALATAAPILWMNEIERWPDVASAQPPRYGVPHADMHTAAHTRLAGQVALHPNPP